MTQWQRMVRKFHERFGVAYRDEPAEAHEVNWPRHTQRLAWITEETIEADEAIVECDVAELADAYLDAIYFALGGLVELGIDGEPLMEAIHSANMRKIKLTNIDKIAKPPGWTAPDIAGLVEAQKKGTL